MGRLFVCIVLALSLLGCTRTVYEPVEVSTTTTEYIDRWRVDTIERTSDRVVERRGDTVYDTSTEYVYKVRERRDTVCIRDSVVVPKPYPIEVRVRELTWWQRAQIYGFRALLITIFVAAGIWYLRKRYLS